MVWVSWVHHLPFHATSCHYFCEQSTLTWGTRLGEKRTVILTTMTLCSLSNKGLLRHKLFWFSWNGGSWSYPIFLFSHDITSLPFPYHCSILSVHTSCISLVRFWLLSDIPVFAQICKEAKSPISFAFLTPKAANVSSKPPNVAPASAKTSTTLS